MVIWDEPPSRGAHLSLLPQEEASVVREATLPGGRRKKNLIPAGQKKGQKLEAAVWQVYWENTYG